MYFLFLFAADVALDIVIICAIKFVQHGQLSYFRLFITCHVNVSSGPGVNKGVAISRYTGESAGRSKVVSA